MSPETKERVPVPLKEAVKRIGRKKRVHTFMSGGPALIGADHDRADLIASMRVHGVEESGPQASAMGHTLVIVNYPVGANRTTPLFIEAAPARVLPAAEDAVSDQTTGSP